jgi:PAS domain S-box-containing protein
MADYDELSNQSKLTAHEQRAEAEALFTSIGDGAISTDEFGRITRVNPTAQQLLGFSEAELVNSWFPKKIMAVTYDDKPINLIDRPITKAFLTGKPVSEKLYYRRKDGHKIALSVNISPIILNGKPLGAIEVFRDITLEQEIDRMKSEFISLASHQLRTPLSATKTYTHMLFDGYMGKLNPAQKKALTTIISATDRMNELISTLLNVTRIESGNVEVTPKLLRLDKIAEEVIKEVDLMASNKSIKLSLIVKGKSSPSIKTDSLIVKEVMTNLISNALKYTPEGGTVELIIHPRKDFVLVEVRDTGWGIPKYSQEQVFSKFFRAQNIVQRETTGTGLGLYLVKGLLEALGGEIWFVSDEGKGTKFSFSLPRRQNLPIRIRAPRAS